MKCVYIYMAWLFVNSALLPKDLGRIKCYKSSIFKKVLDFFIEKQFKKPVIYI